MVTEVANVHPSRLACRRESQKNYRLDEPVHEVSEHNWIVHLAPRILNFAVQVIDDFEMSNS